ncbi:protein trapped in endoderm-1 isoform X2 [Stomoxys calcitrans]|nr:protein trapped in endoderm-1 isoform X2 [Stomoxys calcitrans]XP_059223903.1 protein trapped in endoderm-1 isoform X2 [Stomoxys calcitrans]
MDDKNTLYPHSSTMFAAVSACVLTVVGICGNLVTIIALLKSPKIRYHPTTSFVLSLCISDLLFCSFSLPLTAVRFFKEKWTFGDHLCQIFPVIFYGNVAVSLLSMVCITINRYILIACHNIYIQLYRRKWIICQLAFVWIVSFLLLLPPLLGIWGEMGLDEKTFSCTILKKNGKSIKKALFLTGFLLPCFVIITSYTCIYVKVIQQRKLIKSHREFTGPVKDHTNAVKKGQEDNRLTLMMMTIFICFLVCFLPLMLANVVDDERNTTHPWLHIVASVMAWASSVINPIVYAASNRNYRIAYMKFLGSIKFWEKPISTLASRNSKEFCHTVRSSPPNNGTTHHDFKGCENHSL